jgi:hypothetical protein
VIRTASGACADTSDAYVANLDAMVLDITKTDATTGFNDGTISIAIRSGGTPPYRYSIDNGRTFNDLPNFAELRPATYSVVVIDSRNCRRSRQITINERQPCSILVGATAHNVQCDDTDQLKGRITVLPQEGLAPFRFALDNGAFQSNPTFDNLDARRYRVTAVDNNGCRGAINITVPRSCGR